MWAYDPLKLPQVLNSGSSELCVWTFPAGLPMEWKHLCLTSEVACPRCPGHGHVQQRRLSLLSRFAG